MFKFNTLRVLASVRLSYPEKPVLDLSKTSSTTFFLKKGIHVKPTERSVIGRLHLLTYTHSVAIERILFQYSLLHLKDEPSKFRRNFMFNNQPIKKKNISIYTHRLVTLSHMCFQKRKDIASFKIRCND